MISTAISHVSNSNLAIGIIPMHLRTYSTLLLQDRNKVVSVVSDKSEDQESCLLADVNMSRGPPGIF